jgi:plasmid maintenance system antidote protein VapI
MDQKELRGRLNYACDTIGLKSKTIAKVAGVEESRLSRFKNGKTMLCRPEAKRLENYFDNFFMVEL